jgi:hypothetical protein
MEYFCWFSKEVDKEETRERKKKIKPNQSCDVPKVILFNLSGDELSFPLYHENEIGISSKWRSDIHHAVLFAL